MDTKINMFKKVKLEDIPIGDYVWISTKYNPDDYCEGIFKEMKEKQHNGLFYDYTEKWGVFEIWTQKNNWSENGGVITKKWIEKSMDEYSPSEKTFHIVKQKYKHLVKETMELKNGE